MKKWFSLFLVLLFLGMTFPLHETIETPVGISDREGLLRISENPGGSYVLTADIDLSDEPWTPIPFSGTLDGAGHTIGNLTVTEPGADTATTYDGNRKQYETVFGGLFSVANGAEIRNLTLLNAEIDLTTDRHCFLGAIAGYAKGTTVSDCKISMRGSLTLSSVNAGVGGVIGFAEDCEVRACSVEAELLFIDTNPSVLCEEFLGGVFACGYGSVRECSVYTRGYADVYGYAHNGGVIGMFKVPRSVKKPNYSLNDTSVDAEIRFFEVTPSKRAYCKALIGEDNMKLCKLARNKELHFESEYARKAEPKRPESCSAPVYTSDVTEPTCTEWGYTTYTCANCGYSYRDDYTLPRHSYEAQTIAPTCVAEGKTVYTCKVCGDTYEETLPLADHVPGEWTVTKEAKLNESGQEERRCVCCGEVLETREIPPLEPVLVQTILVDDTVLELHVGETAVLELSVEPFNATDNTVLFESSDPGVVLVDGAGYLSAISVGTATITVKSADGNAKATCSVLVSAVAEEKKDEGLFGMRCG